MYILTWHHPLATCSMHPFPSMISISKSEQHEPVKEVCARIVGQGNGYLSWKMQSSHCSCSSFWPAWIASILKTKISRTAHTCRLVRRHIMLLVQLYWHKKTAQAVETKNREENEIFLWNFFWVWLVRSSRPPPELEQKRKKFWGGSYFRGNAQREPGTVGKVQLLTGPLALN